MRRFLGIVALITLCNISASPVQGNDYNAARALSANFIIAACKESPAEAQSLIGNCWGQIQMLYLLAYMDGLAPKDKVCPPDGVTIAQAKNVVVKYIDDRPELTHTPFAFMAIDALRKAWPCK